MRSALLWIALSAASVSSEASAQSSRWLPSGRDNLLYVKVFKDPDTIAAALSHDHVIRAGVHRAVLDYDPLEPRKCRLSIRVPVDQLVVDEPWLRQKVGFDKPIDDDDRADVKKSMLAEDQLDAARHPVISIQGQHCRPVSEDGRRVAIELAVTVRGRTKRLTTAVSVNQRGRWLQVQGRFRVRHSDFGIKPYSAFLGAVANAEPIELVADVSLLKR